MYNGKVYRGDIGTALKLYTGVDLTGASALQIFVKKPSGAEEIWYAGVDSEDPKTMVHICTGSNLDESGEYLVQAFARFRGGTGWAGRGQTASFFVYEPWT